MKSLIWTLAFAFAAFISGWKFGGELDLRNPVITAKAGYSKEERLAMNQIVDRSIMESLPFVSGGE